MAKRKHRVIHRKAAVARLRRQSRESYLVVVRSWMLLVLFALMLGIGAVVGTYLNQKSLEDTPAVAGAQIEELR